MAAPHCHPKHVTMRKDEKISTKVEVDSKVLYKDRSITTSVDGIILRDKGYDGWQDNSKNTIGGNIVRVLKPRATAPSIPEDCIRFVCISDTHSQVEGTDFDLRVPNGDVLLHAGDFTLHGEIDEYEEFNDFLEKLPHPIKIAIPGNHETSLDPRAVHFDVPALRHALGLPISNEQPSASNYGDVIDKLIGLIPNAVILMDSWVSVCGIKIYGFPWIPQYGALGFGLRKDQHHLEKQNLIPDDTDILLSHGPPHGYGDLTRRNKRVGCHHLLKNVRERIRPRVVVSGHIHEGYGVSADETTTYINAATCNVGYRPKQDPIVFDYQLPKSFSREDLVDLTHHKLTVMTNKFQ